MKNERLPLRLPVFAAPMFLISGPEMVLAACKTGIVGAFPTPNARPIEQLDVWMKAITEGLAAARDTQGANTVGPWCANLVTHSSNTRLAQDLELIARYKPPLVVTALGSPKPAIEVVQAYGGRVFADVINLTLAQKAVKAGATTQEAAEAIGVTFLMHGGPATIHGARAYEVFSEFAGEAPAATEEG